MQWSARLVKYREESRIAVYFDKKKEYIARIKQLPDARWSYRLMAWHVPDNADNRQRFNISLPNWMRKKSEKSNNSAGGCNPGATATTL